MIRHLVLAASAVAALTAVVPADAVAARLDARYGEKGKVVSDVGLRGIEVRAAAPQADGTVFVGGRAYSRGAFAVARFTSAGSLDPRFGWRGVVAMNVGPSNGLFAIAVQPDGKVLAAGGAASTDEASALIMRLNSDGSLDHSFGFGGKVRLRIGTEDPQPPSAVALQPDRRILVMGRRSTLVRLMADGSEDPSFVVSNPAGTEHERAHSLVVQRNGGIVTRTTSGAEGSGSVIRRYLPDGPPDPGFGRNGISRVGGFFGEGMTVSVDGSLLLPGLSVCPESGAVRARTAQSCRRHLLVRLRADGQPDETFGEGGAAVESPLAERQDFFGGVAEAADGGLVAVGSTSGRFLIARASAAGVLDERFGFCGVVTTPFRSPRGRFHVSAGASGVALLPGGRAQVAGGASGPPEQRERDSYAALARYRLDAPERRRASLQLSRDEEQFIGEREPYTVSARSAEASRVRVEFVIDPVEAQEARLPRVVGRTVRRLSPCRERRFALKIPRTLSRRLGGVDGSDFRLRGTVTSRSGSRSVTLTP